MTLQFGQVLLTALLPIFSTVVAGVARQDRAPGWLNDFISLLTPIGAGFANTFANGGFTNGDSLLVLAGSTLFAGISHWDYFMRIQQDLQSKVLSLGVKPATLQAVEHAASSAMPQLEALVMQLLDEIRGGRVMPGQQSPAPTPQFKQPVPITFPAPQTAIAATQPYRPDLMTTQTFPTVAPTAPTTPDPFADSQLLKAVTPGQ